MLSQHVLPHVPLHRDLTFVSSFTDDRLTCSGCMIVDDCCMIALMAVMSAMICHTYKLHIEMFT